MQYTFGPQNQIEKMFWKALSPNNIYNNGVKIIFASEITKLFSPLKMNGTVAGNPMVDQPGWFVKISTESSGFVHYAGWGENGGG